MCGRSLSRLLTYRQIFSQNQVYPQDMYNLTQPKSYLPFDLPNVFNFINTYDLPFGTGKHFFGSSGRLVNAIIGGWTIADTHQYRSGALFALNCANTLGNGVLFTDARMCDANRRRSPDRPGPHVARPEQSGQHLLQRGGVLGSGAVLVRNLFPVQRPFPPAAGAGGQYRGGEAVARVAARATERGCGCSSARTLSIRSTGRISG